MFPTLGAYGPRFRDRSYRRDRTMLFPITFTHSLELMIKIHSNLREISTSQAHVTEAFPLFYHNCKVPATTFPNVPKAD